MIGVLAPHQSINQCVFLSLYHLIFYLRISQFSSVSSFSRSVSLPESFCLLMCLPSVAVWFVVFVRTSRSNFKRCLSPWEPLLRNPVRTGLFTS